jgi:low affinity Fe/Cu permease
MVVATSSVYINTLIFCIIAKFVTVATFLLLLWDKTNQYWIAISVVEFGLIAIIVLTLWKVHAMQKKLDELQTASSVAPAQIDTCPDYFVKTVTSEDTKCNAVYETPNGQYKYVFTDTRGGPPIGDIGFNSLTTAPTGSCDNSSAYVSQTMSQLCTNAQALGSYQKMSWTDMKAKCGSLDSAAT